MSHSAHDQQGDSGADRSWRSLWLASGALSVAQLGDSLIYIVLPVNADVFGVSLAWVGILLAANRIIRTFTYGIIASLGERFGLKNLCIFATVTAILSTAAYGLVQGGPALLAARSLWGLSYGALLLVTLGYAATDRARTGARVGVSRSIEQVGPLASLTLGTWLAGIIGAQEIFLVLALGTVIALWMAMQLPTRQPSRGTPPTRGSMMLSKPSRLDLLIFWMGCGVDGVFLMTITIMVARHTSVELAMLSGGLIIAGRRIAEMVAAPVSGVIADRFGVRRPVTVASVLLIAGFTLVGSGWLIPGAIAMVIARGALGTLLPTAVAYFVSREDKGAAVLQPLARNQTWRDLGAAVGPLSTGFLLTIATPEVLHLALAAIFTAFFLWLICWRGWRVERADDGVFR